MGEYRQKNIKVRAYRVTRDVEMDAPPWLTKPFQQDRIEIDRALVDGAARVYGCNVRTPEGKILAKIGDYIVMEPDGSLRVCKGSHFKTLYEQAGA